jgi:hypothetical protein
MTREATFQDEPEAHAFYSRMMQVTSQAASLYYESLFDSWHGPEQIVACTYQVWIRKRPFGVRVEMHQEETLAGVLVDDGKQTWVYWPGGARQIEERIRRSTRERGSPLTPRRSPIGRC